MSREAVHLSINYESAQKIGLRHAAQNKAKTYVFEIDAKQMYLDGFKFYKSEDGVWLTDFVPCIYLRQIITLEKAGL